MKDIIQSILEFEPDDDYHPDYFEHEEKHHIYNGYIAGYYDALNRVADFLWRNDND